MPNYRYKTDKLPLVNIEKYLPDTPTAKVRAGAVILEVDVAATSKPDLDDYMSNLGATFLGADPATTAAQAFQAANAMGGASAIELAVADLESGEGAGVRIGETTYQPLLHHIWRGSDVLGAPSSIKVVAKSESGTAGREVSVRIVDRDNSDAVICEKTDILTNDVFTILDMGALSNVSASQALWEVQGERTNGGGVRDGRLSLVSIFF